MLLLKVKSKTYNTCRIFGWSRANLIVIYLLMSNSQSCTLQLSLWPFVEQNQVIVQPSLLFLRKTSQVAIESFYNHSLLFS